MVLQCCRWRAGRQAGRLSKETKDTVLAGRLEKHMWEIKGHSKSCQPRWTGNEWPIHCTCTWLSVDPG